MRRKLKNKWIHKGHESVRRTVRFAWRPIATSDGYLLWWVWYERREVRWGWAFKDTHRYQLKHSIGGRERQRAVVDSGALEP